MKKQSVEKKSKDSLFWYVRIPKTLVAEADRVRDWHGQTKRGAVCRMVELYVADYELKQEGV